MPGKTAAASLLVGVVGTGWRLTAALRGGRRARAQSDGPAGLRRGRCREQRRCQRRSCGYHRRFRTRGQTKGLHRIGGSPGGSRDHAGGCLRRRLVEIEHDAIAFAANAIRDRLDEADPDARARCDRRVGGLDAHLGDRALRIGDEPVGHAVGGYVTNIDEDRERIGTGGDIRHRIAGFDDERSALGADARTDRLESDAARNSRPLRWRRADERARRRHRDEQRQGSGRCHCFTASIERSNFETSRCLTSDSGSLTS